MRAVIFSISTALCVSSAQQVYKDATFDVQNITNITYCEALTCTDQFDNTTCSPMVLQLDVYFPVAKKVPIPSLKPAYILSHGGGNSGGSKEQFCFQVQIDFTPSLIVHEINKPCRVLVNFMLHVDSLPLMYVRVRSHLKRINFPVLCYVRSFV
jgi:hypothetical protein